MSLLLHILFTTGFGLVVKDAQVRGRNLWVVGAVNYIIAALTAGISLLHVTIAEPNAIPYQFSHATLIVGILAGVGYVVAYFFLLTVVQLDGISVSMAVVRLSVVVPVIFSIFYWHEIPNGYQIIGIVLVCAALPLLGRNQTVGDKAANSRLKGLILILFVLTGWCALSTKMFVQVSPEDSREIFLLFLFGSAAAIGILPLIVGRMRPTLADITPGILLGLCNIFGNHFLLIALSRLPGIVVFPIASSVGVSLNTVLAVAVWHEKIRRPVVIGIAISIVALIFINLK